MKLYDSVNNVLKRLDDYPAVGSESVWTRDEIELYLQDGYDAFCRQTRCLWDMFYPENVPQTGNHVGEWEEDYFDSGMIRTGLMNFSGGYWEADYAEAGAIGPRNSTQPWEADYLDHIFASSLHPVPKDNVSVERATYDWIDLDPEFTAWFQEQDRSFQTTLGTPSRFAMDKDGMSWMRVVPAGNGAAQSYKTAGAYGLLRTAEYAPATAYWSLDETTGDREDAVGSLDLSATGAPSAVTGVYGYGCEFGTGKVLSVAHNVLVQGGNVDLSISLWFYCTATTSDQYVLIGIENEWKVFISGFGGTTNIVRFGWWESDGTAIGTVGPEVTLNEWHLIIAWRDQTAETLNIQMDSGTVYSRASTNGGQVGTEAFGVGAYGDNSKNFPGVIDDVRVYKGLWTDEEKEALARDYTDPFGEWSPSGTWGTLRETPKYFEMGGQWGIPRRLYSDTKNTRVEYFRLGYPLEEYPYQVPERFAKYVEFYAAAKALERDGPGQDLKLASHFLGRFQEGVDRMTKRLSENKRSRLAKIGSTGKGPTRPALARLPWQYGRAIRRGY